ncbi:hypothetical protein MJO29_013821, partial [Puccinia striiformis f. sp. tritici]
PRMFLQIRALVVYGTLLTLVTGTTGTFTPAQLSRQIYPEMFDSAKYCMGNKMFKCSALDVYNPGPGESSLTLMEFHERAGREMRLDPKDLDRFVNSYLSAHMEEQYVNEKLELGDLYEDHLEWLKTNDAVKDRCGEASAALLKKIDETPKESLRDYYTNIMDGKILNENEEMKFVEWKLGQIWRARHKDTKKMRIEYLLAEYMEWAQEDPKLKDNWWVVTWAYSLGKQTESIVRLVERLKRSPWHRRVILRTIKNFWRKYLKKILIRKPESDAHPNRLTQSWWPWRSVFNKIGHLWQTLIQRGSKEQPMRAL